MICVALFDGSLVDGCEAGCLDGNDEEKASVPGVLVTQKSQIIIGDLDNLIFSVSRCSSLL